MSFSKSGGLFLKTTSIKDKKAASGADRTIDSDYTHCEEERDDKQWKTHVYTGG